MSERGIEQRWEHLWQMFQSLPMAIAMFDNEMRYLVANQRWRERYAFTRVIEGNTHAELTDVALVPNDATLRQCLTGVARSCEADPLPRADGTVDWVRWEARPWYSADGTMGGVLAFAQRMFDEVVTARRVNEDLVRKLSRAVEQSPSSVVITDVRGTIEYVNPKFCQVTGFSAEEVLGRNPNVLKSGLMTSTTYRQLWETISRGGEWRGQLQNRKKSGELFWEQASISGLRDENGAITHYVAVKEDITDLKRATDELQESERRYRHLVDNIPAGVALERDEKIVLVNRYLLGLLGFSEEEVAGKELHSLAVSREDLRALESRAPSRESTLEVPLRAKCGRTLPCRVSAWPIDATDPTKGRVWLIECTAAEKEAERQKEIFQTHMRQTSKLASIGTFFGSLAHEINDPLAIVQGYIPLLRQHLAATQADARLLDALTKQERAVGRIATVVSGLRAYSVVDTDHADRLDVHALLEENLRLVAQIYRKAEVAVEKRFNSEEPIVHANHGRLQQALMNLLPTGAEALSASGSEEKRILIETEDRGSELAILLSTTGISGPASDPIEGVGLSVCQSIVEGLGGKVRKKDTVMEVLLPKARAIAESSRRLQGRALVVDDEEDIREILRTQLEELGLEVIEARSGLEALDRMAEGRFEYVFTDIHMPQMSGDVLLERARALQPKARCVVVTGFYSESDASGRWQRVRQFADSILLKPFSPKALEDAVF